MGSALVWLLVAFDLFVLAFMLFSSLKTTREIFDAPWLPPLHPVWGNWSHAWSGSGFGRAAVNTAVLVGASSAAIVLIAAPAGYMLSRTRSRAAELLTILFTLGIGVPTQVLIIPLFVMMSHVGLVDSLTGLFVVYTALSLPFTVFLLTGFFRALPEELEEAATLDGAGTARTYWTVMLPLARSGIITALILNAISLWNETLIALVFIQSDNHYTLSLSLLSFLTSMQTNHGDYGGLFAGVCILVLPMLAVYVWLSRRIIEGMTLGAGK